MGFKYKSNYRSWKSRKTKYSRARLPLARVTTTGILKRSSMGKVGKPATGTYVRTWKPFPYALNQVFKPRLFKKLTYTQTATLTASSTGNSSGSAQIWRLNSLFDPDYTGVGHQPLWFDEIKALGYTNYLVHGCEVTLTFTDPSADGMYVAYGLDTPALDDPIASVFHDYLKEYPRTLVKYINNTGSQKVTDKFYVNCAKACNVSKIRYNTNPDYSSLTTGNPSKSPIIQCVCGAINPSNASTPTVQCTVKLRYWVEFFDSDNYPGPS